MFGSSALGDVYKTLCAALEPAAAEQAATEARIILETRAQVQWSDIIASPHKIIDAQILDLIAQDLQMRIEGQKALSRIYGTRGFWGLDFEVTPHTLDPRQTVGHAAGRGMVDAGKAAETVLAQQRHMDGEGQRAETGIGADVRRRLFAADVLFAG